MDGYVYCTVCGRPKQPVGRDAPAAMGNSLCHPTECKGYFQDPQPVALWPGEKPDTKDPPGERVDDDMSKAIKKYHAWLRKRPCSWCSTTCRTEVSHHNLSTLGPSGTSLKSSGWRAVNLCPGCHRCDNPNWHDHRRLGDMTAEETRYWLARKTIDLLVEYLETVLNPEVL